MLDELKEFLADFLAINGSEFEAIDLWEQLSDAPISEDLSEDETDDLFKQALALAHGKAVIRVTFTE